MLQILCDFFSIFKQFLLERQTRLAAIENAVEKSYFLINILIKCSLFFSDTPTNHHDEQGSHQNCSKRDTIVARESKMEYHYKGEEIPSLFWCSKFYSSQFMEQNLIGQGPIKSRGEPKHMLWALLFLKVCSTEEVHCSMVGWSSAKTLSKWAWYFVMKR